MGYYRRKGAQLGVTFLVVIHLSFVMMMALPGGPARYLRARLVAMGAGGESRSLEEANRLVEAYLNVNPQATIWERYVSYMTSLVQGDLGKSIWLARPVTDVYLEALPWTIFMMGTAIVLSYGVGVVLGAFMAYREGSRFDTGTTIVGIVAMSVPYYILAVFLLWFLSVKHSIFPFSGRYPQGMKPAFSIPFIKGALYHAALPIISVTLTWTGLVAIAMRGNSISILGQDYLRVARLRGLSNRTISIRYVGRNAILPLYTRFMIALGTIFGGSVIIEELFLYKGMGFYLFLGINSRDYPLVMGGFIIITLTVLTGIFIAELTYGYIDPRAGRGVEQ